jgi:hypothetical protein
MRRLSQLTMARFPAGLPGDAGRFASAFCGDDGVAIRAVPGTTAHTAGWMGSMIGVLVVFDPLVPVPPRRYLAAAGTGGYHSTTLRLSDRPASG